VQRKQDRADGARLRHGDALAQALQFDMADRFTPTVANIFGRISRDAILMAMTEAKGSAPAPAWAKMKKAELASIAEREIAGTGWLPAPMQIENAVELADADHDDTEDFAQAAE
jgi:ParB family chromosome partitioning protein